MIIGTALFYWLGAALLAAMATFALLEVKSSSLIPKSLFWWPAMGFFFGLLAVAFSFVGGSLFLNSYAIAVTGLAMLLCSAQSFFVNIRRLTRWPSGAVWAAFIVVCVLYQFPAAANQEPLFQNSLRRLSGIIWGCIGAAKIIGEKTVSQDNATPLWIQLLYVQAVLFASYPY